MSLTYNRGDIVFQCDACKATLETNTSNFDAAMNVLRRSRWRPVPHVDPTRRNKITRSSPDWDHHCDQCKAEQKRLV